MFSSFFFFMSFFRYAAPRARSERTKLFMISIIQRTYSFIRDALSCCDKKSTAVSPAVMQGTKRTGIKVLSDNSVNCTCCVFNGKKKGRRRKDPETELSERPLLQKHEQLCNVKARPAPGPHPGGGEELISKRTPNSESSFHSALTRFASPPNSSPSPLIASNSPAHTAILRQLGEAVQGTISLRAPKGGSIIKKVKPDSTSLVGKGPGDQLMNNISLLIPKLLPPFLIGSILWAHSSAGDIFSCIVDYDMSTLTTKVDLEALAQAQKVGEAVGSMQESAPAEGAALEIEQQVSCPHKIALWAAGFLLVLAIAYSRYY